MGNTTTTFFESDTEYHNDPPNTNNTDFDIPSFEAFQNLIIKPSNRLLLVHYYARKYYTHYHYVTKWF